MDDNGMPQLAGTMWSATAVNNGKGGVTSRVGGTTLTLVFGADGTLSGTAGCNNYTGGYEVTGGSVRFPAAFASTRKMCAEDVMDQEQAFFRALSASTSAQINGDRLELRDATGALQITAMKT
jgi:heat shock protein HslJ